MKALHVWYKPKYLIHLIIIFSIILLSGCEKKSTSTVDNISPTPVSGTKSEDNISPTPGGGTKSEDNISPTPGGGTKSEDKIYFYDASKEWNVDENVNTHNFDGQDFYYFSTGIECPYKYTYKSKDNEDIDTIANKLAEIMMNDFMRDYKDKAFTVTEYRNIDAHILINNELKAWLKRYNIAGPNIELQDNQWLVTIGCEYKYTGVYSGIGPMPSDMEWNHGLTQDGSGENYVFIIQKENDGEYIMRALPKTVLQLKGN